ncbi:transposase, partial [Escherichia coli]|nr:transposase [Escherichia coli]
MDISALNTTNDIEKLRAMALAMVQKVMSENAEKERELLEKSRRIQLLEEMLKLVRQQRFGKKCETLAGMQRSLFEEDVDADIAALTAHLDKLLPQSPEEDEKAPRSRPIRKPLPVHLPRVEKIIQPDTDHCPECDEPLHYIRDAVSEKLEYIPAHFVVNRYIRPQYSCPCCQKVFSGEMPAHILPKSAVEPSVIAQVIINKYGDHLPLYRQQQVFARSDVGLPVSSMAAMVGAAGRALHKAIVYALSHRVELSRFLEDGAVPLDNNVCERAIKNVVLGRKSWLFAGSQMAGERAAQIMSLLETAKRNGLEPHAWLTDVLMRLPEWPEE